jgi:hypothetical protein
MIRPRVEVEADGGGGDGGGGGCFLTGTRLASPEGAVRVEDVSVGSMVLTANGEARAVRWIGHRNYNCDQAPKPAVLWPIQIKAGAFADAQPSRDLWVSPGHAILVGGVLIHSERLVNGATIIQVPRHQVQYWHVELDSHDVLLAEDLPAESYLDMGNRLSFANGGPFVEAHPDFRPKHWADTCVPLVLDGPELERAKTMLIERAQILGYKTTAEPDAHISADGNRIEPVMLRPDCMAFVLPPHCSSIELRSRQFVPAQMKPSDKDFRSLGINVRRLQIDGLETPLEQEQPFASGWHGQERDPENGSSWRWTTGSASLPGGARLIVVELNLWGTYWQSTPDHQPEHRLTAVR